jgi:hypothetical protein
VVLSAVLVSAGWPAGADGGPSNAQSAANRSCAGDNPSIVFQSPFSFFFFFLFFNGNNNNNNRTTTCWVLGDDMNKL